MLWILKIAQILFEFVLYLDSKSSGGRFFDTFWMSLKSNPEEWRDIVAVDDFNAGATGIGQICPGLGRFSEHVTVIG